MKAFVGSTKDWGYTRDDEYYAKTALKRIEQWKNIVNAESLDSMEKRGLVLEPPLDDQQLLLSLREQSSIKQIQELMKKLLPYHAANTALVMAFNTEYGKYLDGETVDFDSVWDFVDNPHVSEDTFGRMLINIKLIVDPYANPHEVPEPVSEEEEEK